MNEAIILLFISIFFSVLVIYWISITVSLIYRGRRTVRLNKIEHTFADVVSRYLYNDPSNPISLSEITSTLREVGIRPENKNNIQFLIRLMIRTQRTILGSNFHKLQQLYTQIPPYGVSIKKISSWSWYRRARESLRFLPYLQRNMTLWQQIKITEKLYDLYPKPELKWLHRAYKTEKLFGKKLLMRIIRKYLLHGEIGFIVDHLNYEVRETAIYCIQTFAVNNSTMDYIKKLYEDIPNATQQGQLLTYIFENSDIDLEFYMKQLYGKNDELKLSVAEILWNSGYKEKVQEFYYQQYPNSVLNVG